MIQFQDNAQTDRRKDGRTGRPYFIGPFPLMPGAQKYYVIFKNRNI